MKGWSLIVVAMMWSRSAGASGVITMSPDPLDTGNVVVGASTPTATGTLSDTVNGDSVDLVVTSTCTGTGAGAFVLNPTTILSPNLNSPKTVVNTFTPTARGLLNCVVNVNDHTTALTLATFHVQGTGVAAVVAAALPSNNFGAVRWNDLAPVHTVTQTLTITNNGDSGQNLTVSAITLGGTNPADYAVGAGCLTTIAPAASATCTVTFNPVATGTSSATLTIATNDPITPNKTLVISGTGSNAVIAVTNIAFGIVADGSSSALNTSVSNTGAVTQGALGVTGATFSGNTAGWFTFNGNGCVGTSTTCTFSSALSITTTAVNVPIKCAPPSSASGMQTATIAFTSDTDSATNNTATVTCTAGQAGVSVDMPSLDFGNQLVGTTSSAKTVTITNTGNINLTYSITLTGTNPSQFSLAAGTAGCITSCTVAPGLTSTFAVKFSPTTQSANSALARITSNSPTSPLDVSLAGNGIAPDVASSPTSLAFGSVEVGKTSASQLITVTNTGTAILSITSAGLVAGTDFAVTAGTAGAQMIAPGLTATWMIDCAPTTFGVRSDSFQVISNALNTPTLAIPLSCTGQQGVLTISGSPFDFGGVRIGDTVTHNFTLTNIGNVAVNTISATLSNTTVGYSIVSPTFPLSTLGAGASVTVTVQFAPQLTTDGGPITITFAGVWGSTNTATMAVLSVTGSALVAGYDFAPKPKLDFGDIRFDQNRTLTFSLIDTNSSTVTIETLNVVLGTALTGEFTITGQTHNGTAVSLPFALTGVNDTLVVSVKCQPANRVAMLSASVAVHSDLGTNPDRTIPLVANSTTAGITVTPATNVLDFGAVDLQLVGSLTQTITLTNNGTAPLNTGAATKTGADLARFAFTTTGAQVIAPGASFSVMVTYTPTVERASNNPDAASITFPLVGVFGGPTSATVMLQGYGISRHLQLAPVPAFPNTFRNPGDKAPILPITVTNTGDATLSISAVMLSNDPVWTVVNMDPVDVPGKTSYDFMVRFAPTVAGKAPDGQLVIFNNDLNTPMAMVTVTGYGIDRNVEMGPPVIDLPLSGVGSTLKLSTVAPGELLHVASLDNTNTFMIHAIGIDGGDGAFAVEDLQGKTPANVSLAPGATQQFDITFTPQYEGDFVATATLYLDMDPTAQTTVTIKGHALFVDAHGGGGCSTGAGAGAGMVIVLGALLLGRRRRLLALAIAVAPSASRADTRNLDMTVFDPTPSTTGETFQLQSASVGEDGDLVVTALASYANNPLVLGTVQNTDTTIKTRTMLELGGAYAFLGRFEAGARMPLYVQSGSALDSSGTMFGEPPASGTARGDLTLHGKLRLWHRGMLTLGTGLALTLPTATPDEFAGVSKPSGRALALVSVTPSALDHRLAVAINSGAVIRARSRFHDIDQGSGIAWGVGASYRVLDELWVAAELFGDLIPSGQYTRPAPMQPMGAAKLLSTVEALAGLHYQMERRVSLGVAVGRGVTTGIGSPDVRGVFTLAFAPSAAATVPIHGIVVPRVDGDRDGDGIPDSVDKCPDEPEDKDMFDDADGCPDPDNDADGIPDEKDKCPLDPEDYDGFQDEDGCPDKDNDNDGIPDARDKCPNEPEDRDGFQDMDGCPDPDNDGDGIPDIKDKCPNEPETVNGFQDDDGCPDRGDALVVLSPDRLELLDAIQFTGGAKIAKASFNVLGQVAATLRGHSEIVRIRITAHSQPTSNPDRDQQLSDKRAQAVRDWLVQWGVAPQRLEARGFGGTKPLVPADQRGAAPINERLELIILERR